jgi:hypothetical protein
MGTADLSGEDVSADAHFSIRHLPDIFIHFLKNPFLGDTMGGFCALRRGIPPE